MECSKALVLELALGNKADGSQWTAKRRRDGRLALGNEVDGLRWTAWRWHDDGVLEGLAMKHEMARRWTARQWTAQC